MTSKTETMTSSQLVTVARDIAGRGTAWDDVDVSLIEGEDRWDCPVPSDGLQLVGPSYSHQP
jgi:hypothetical protein